MLRIQKPFTLVKAFAYSKINSNAPVRHVFAAFHICINPDNRRLVASRFATHQRTKEGKTNFSEDDSCWNEKWFSSGCQRKGICIVLYNSLENAAQPSASAIFHPRRRLVRHSSMGLIMLFIEKIFYSLIFVVMVKRIKKTRIEGSPTTHNVCRWERLDRWVPNALLLKWTWIERAVTFQLVYLLKK